PVWSILRNGVVGAGGHEVEARADEFFAVFESPRAAIDAAIALQNELRQQRWIDDHDVRVRIGIHSGYPTSTDTNYVGMDVNAASRITSVGHGGQVVVSANTHEWVKASDPGGVRFKALGSYKLRGLPDEMALYQLVADGLPRTFPALRISR
ncbi:MAG TPA: adenylate/guanylate cyclase domain-containing protein, partial [Ilumatobacteraceae bacterium]